jgi:hypothetical protein
MRATLLLLLAACGTNMTPQPAPAPTLPNCVPNRDGTITADELPIALGATLAYYEGANRTIDQTAHSGAYDLSQERPDDTLAHLGPVALDAQWYAAQFPTGEFVTDAGSGIDGIYHQDDRALWLDGTASHDMNPTAGKTLVIYSAPVPVLRFPIAVGDAYTVTAPLPSATVDGLPFVGSDAFSIGVADSARLDVPYVQFSPTLRVQTSLVRSAGAASVGKRSTSFLFECFGEVARADSNANESSADFTNAAALRRFALGE